MSDRYWVFNVVGRTLQDNRIPYVSLSASEGSYVMEHVRTVLESQAREKFARDNPGATVDRAWWAWVPILNDESEEEDEK